MQVTHKSFLFSSYMSSSVICNHLFHLLNMITGGYILTIYHFVFVFCLFFYIFFPLSLSFVIIKKRAQCCLRAATHTSLCNQHDGQRLLCSHSLLACSSFRADADYSLPTHFLFNPTPATSHICRTEEEAREGNLDFY